MSATTTSAFIRAFTHKKPSINRSDGPSDASTTDGSRSDVTANCKCRSEKDDKNRSNDPSDASTTDGGSSNVTATCKIRSEKDDKSRTREKFYYRTREKILQNARETSAELERRLGLLPYRASSRPLRIEFYHSLTTSKSNLRDQVKKLFRDSKYPARLAAQLSVVVVMVSYPYVNGNMPPGLYLV